MDDSRLLNYAFFALVGGAVAWSLLSRLRVHLERKRFIRENGCQEPPLVPPAYWMPLGIAHLDQMLKAAKEHRLLEHFRKTQMLKEGDRTSQVSFLGETVFVTIDPRNIQAMLALKFDDFELGPNRNDSFRPLLGHGIFASDGAAWERSRALLRPSFVKNRVADMDIYEDHVSKLIKLIPADGGTVDLQPLFFRMTLDSATEFLLGKSAGVLEAGSSAEGEYFAKHFNIALDALAMRIRIGPLKKVYYSSKFNLAVKEARRFVEKFVQEAIDRRIAIQNGQEKEFDEDQSYIFSHELCKRTLDKTEITDQLLNILLAGRDTTASLLSLVFFQLARHPDIWAKLQAEVALLNGRKPNFEQLKGLKYLSWVLNETLRLYPIVPRNSRTAAKDTFLPVGGGPDGKSPVFVAKGQDVAYDTYAMHRLPEIFGPDAEVYRPERWGENLRPGWGYLPFNGGPRICIGQQFALTEVGYVITRIMQRFKKIESRDDRPWEEALALTLASKNGTVVALSN